MSRRSDNIRFKRMPNGDIRCFQGDTFDKRGVAEWQITNPRNESPTVTTAGHIKVFLTFETE